MAGVKIRAKLKASSILEVVVSMVVIVLIFGIAMMIYSNVLRLSLSAKQLRAEAILRDRMLSSNNDTAGSNELQADAEFRIEEKRQPYQGLPNLTDLDLTAFDQNNQKIAEIHQLILN